MYTVTKGLTFTFEEYSTLLAEIEAVLNSRPLTPMSNDLDDITVLTPSHFLIGTELLEPVSHDFTDIPENRLTRWQNIQKIKQHFWKRWQAEYLHRLQSRSKWNVKGADIELGTLVLLRDENQPPLHWAMGRVVGVCPGHDGVIRVCDVRTPHGVFRRCMRKLCVLPLDD